MRTVHAAVAHWRPIAAHFGWEEIIATDDLERGGKLSTFLIRLTDNTELVWDSIASYFWGLRVMPGSSTLFSSGVLHGLLYDHSY